MLIARPWQQVILVAAKTWVISGGVSRDDWLSRTVYGAGILGDGLATITFWLCRR